ncbi:hypothetical protein M422DRAFT_203587 [Sphaerobolus stellatus SS14]|nr:hypothetical protein M422DRAFT_203587 [Sphaerobolus stellatus SS14]
MSDWEASEDEVKNVPKVIPKKKWEGEDEEENSAPDDWEESSEEEEEKPAPTVVAPPKKKGTLKAKIAEKEASKAAHRASDDVDELEDVIDPAEKKRLDRERELKADMMNAAELFGSVAIDSSTSKELDSLLTANPRTKEEFQEFSDRIIELVIKKHESKPLYAAFVEHHVKALAQPLKDIDVRKAASGLTTLANEKQREARDKASGKKKSKAAAKPTLGGAKSASRLDTSVYSEALDDFDAGDDDFM